MQSIIVLILGGKHLAGAKMHYVSPLQLMNKCSLCSYVIIYQQSSQRELQTSQIGRSIQVFSGGQVWERTGG